MAALKVASGKVCQGSPYIAARRAYALTADATLREPKILAGDFGVTAMSEAVREPRFRKCEQGVSSYINFRNVPLPMQSQIRPMLETS